MVLADTRKFAQTSHQQLTAHQHQHQHTSSPAHQHQLHQLTSSQLTQFFQTALSLLVLFGSPDQIAILYSVFGL